LVIAVLLLTTALSLIFPALHTLPDSLTFTTAPYWKAGVDWITINYFDVIEAGRVFVLLNFLNPLRAGFEALPWFGVVLVLTALGWRLGGWGLALIVTPIIDTLQTIPSFCFIIPVVMLFRVGDVTALIATIAFSIVPAVRYTNHGIRQVPHELLEAGIVSGCTRWQLFRRVQLPVAMPEIMLGINQTILLSLSMIIICAMVGTRDLGQEVFKALSKADAGRGIVAGLVIAFIGIIADRLITAWVQRMRQRRGMA
jgi:glycine betaine/proline transport system permease protein